MTAGRLLAIMLTVAGPAWAALTPAVAAGAPPFERFLDGLLTGTGEVITRRDGTHRPFTITIQAAWSGGRGTETETLVYADGETKHFAWTFDRIAEGRYVGRRDDLVGTAEVTQDGDVLRMVYKARTRIPSGAVWTLGFDERFTPEADGRVTMLGDVSYLFVTVASTRMTITKAGH